MFSGHIHKIVLLVVDVVGVFRIYVLQIVH